jgi:hypothetical protein
MILIGLTDNPPKIGEIFVIFTSFCLILAFTIFFFTAIQLHFLFKGNEKFEIKGVDIRIFKTQVKKYWIACWISLLISIVIGYASPVLLPAAVFLFFYHIILSNMIKSVIYNKFISVVLKKTPTIKDFKVEDLYVDVREILLRKIVS